MCAKMIFMSIRDVMKSIEEDIKRTHISDNYQRVYWKCEGVEMVIKSMIENTKDAKTKENLTRNLDEVIIWKGYCLDRIK